MSTAADIVRDALKELGVLAAGESLRAEDLADGIRALNRLLGTWANDRLLVHGTRRTAYTLTPSLSPHTIGVGGTLNVARPVRIDGAGVIQSGSGETPLRLLTDTEWRAISDKAATSSVPDSLWVEWTHPTAKLWLSPVPTTAASLVLYTWSRITELLSSDTVSLPDGYEDALVLSLALRMSAAYGVEPSSALVMAASDAVSAIRRTNEPESLLRCDPAVLGAGGFNLITGDV